MSSRAPSRRPASESEADMLVQQMLPLFRAIWPFVLRGGRPRWMPLAASVGSYLMAGQELKTAPFGTFPPDRVVSISLFGRSASSRGVHHRFRGGLLRYSGGRDAILTVERRLPSARERSLHLRDPGLRRVANTAMANRLPILDVSGGFLLVFLSVQLETMFFAFEHRRPHRRLGKLPASYTAAEAGREGQTRKSTHGPRRGACTKGDLMKVVLSG